VEDRNSKKTGGGKNERSPEGNRKGEGKGGEMGEKLLFLGVKAPGPGDETWVKILRRLDLETFKVGIRKKKGYPKERVPTKVAVLERKRPREVPGNCVVRGGEMKRGFHKTEENGGKTSGKEVDTTYGTEKITPKGNTATPRNCTVQAEGKKKKARQQREGRMCLTKDIQ